MKRFLFIAGMMVIMSGCVSPDQYRLLENRVAAIEAETYQKASEQEESSSMAQIREEITASAQTGRENYAEVKYELQQVKDRFHRMESQLEELRHNLGSSDQTRKEAVEHQLERLDGAVTQNFERIIALEKYMGFEPSKAISSGQQAPPVEEGGPAPDSEQGAYETAKAAYDAGDMEGARLQFENFINKYPTSDNADNARFWIAESYYKEKWFEKAILEYQKVLETYPDSNKAAAARLKQGYAFAELGEKANARLILNELIKRHPKANEAKYATEKLKSLN